MTEAEFERRIAAPAGATDAQAGGLRGNDLIEPVGLVESKAGNRISLPTYKARAPRIRPAKPHRVQRMFAFEEDVDEKIWPYAVHMGEDRRSHQ